MYHQEQDFLYIPEHLILEEFEDTKGAIRISQSKKDRQHNDQKKKGQKDKQRSTKRTHKIKDWVNTNLTKNRGWTQLFRKGK